MNIKVKGGQALSGEIHPSGSKNSAVALIPASILFDKPVTFNNVPDIEDVRVLQDILTGLGSKIEWNKEKNKMTIDNKDLKYESLTSVELASMRGTSLLWGPLLSRFKKVTFSDLPRGCTLGLRPMTAHYKAFEDLGVVVTEDIDSIQMDANKAKAKEIWLYEMSPTATENALLLATGLKGNTKIVGAASEPQVQNLCEFLIDCGAKINGVGSSVLEIEGGRKLTPKEHTIWSDHYEITTFLALGALTGGEIRVHNALPGKLENILNVFRRFGIEIGYEGETAVLKEGQKVDFNGEVDQVVQVKAQPWPGLPVDTLPLFIPLALSANQGQVLFHNWMYEAGLFWTNELQKLGANIIMADPHRVVVTAGNNLIGDQMEAPYIIRAVVAMVMSAMIAEGESTILNADSLYRGHPNFSENLRRLGAKIEEVD